MWLALAWAGYSGSTLWIKLASAVPDEMRSLPGPVPLRASFAGVDFSDLVSIATEGLIRSRKRNTTNELTCTGLPSTRVGWYFHSLTAARAASPRAEEQFIQFASLAVCT